MSIDLNSLVDDSGTTSLDDLVSAPNTAEMPINNQATANTLAGHAALLTEPSAVVDNYNTMKGEFAQNQGSPTYDDITKQANDYEDDASSRAMVDILGDSTKSIDERVSAASLWKTGQVGAPEQRPVSTLVATHQLTADSTVRDNEEVDNTRWDIAPHLKAVNDYNEEVNKKINAYGLANNPSIVEKGKDLLETLVPFMSQANAAAVQTTLRTSLGQDDTNSLATGVVKSFGMLGESKEEIRAMLAKVPLDKRPAVMQQVYDAVVAHQGSIGGDKNSLNAMNNMREYLQDGQYGTGSRIVDDAASLMDLLGVGALARGAKKLVGGAKAVDATDSVARAAVIQNRNVLSAGETVVNTNAKNANELLNLAVKDDTGKVADAIYGTTRNDAIVNNIGPEIGNEAGVVRHKPLIDDDQFDPDYEAIGTVTNPNGSIQFSQAEKNSKLSSVTNDFTNPDVTGLVARKEMTTIKAVDGGVNVRTILAPADGGFSDPVQALQQVKLATRKYGLQDSELQVLKRAPDGTYSPVQANDVVKGPDLPDVGEATVGGPPVSKNKGNYVVAINHTSEYDPTDTIAWSTTSVGGKIAGILPMNIFDKMPVMLKGKAGSITQHLIAPQAYTDPLLARSASVTADKIAHSHAVLLKRADEYASNYKGLSSAGKSKIDNYILQANHDSLKFNPEKLRADGWTTEEMSTIRAWKSTQDTQYVLENTDMARQAKRKGFMMLETSDGQDQFLTKPISNSTASNMKITKAYDPDIGKIRTISKTERQELYAQGGNMSIARTPVVIGDQSIPYVIVKNGASNYERAIRDTDKLLNYRDGHFTIYYKNPVFITKEVKNADGSVYTRAVATAGSIKDGQSHLDRLLTTDPKGKYSMRTDRVGEDIQELNWNARVNAGRTAQRTRGEMLADVTDRPTDLDFRHIASPEESLLRSINSISKRINMKEWLDTAKTRFMNQYKDILPRDPETHAPYWPDSVKDLRKPNLTDDSRAYTDAISTYRYIDQMDNGFVNLIDDGSKNFFKAIADTAGKKGFGYLETAARKAEDVNPSAFARKKAFRLLLASNPARQIVVQASQAFPVILATNPLYLPKLPFQLMLTRYLDRGGDLGSFFKGVGSKLSGLNEAEATAMAKAYKDSGISSAVGAHSLIRDDLRSLVNRGKLQKIATVAGKPLDVMQKVGFEAGENMLMRSVWLSEYDNLIKSGKEVNASSLALMHARVRDLTLNMNKAGELAYNENALSAIMQFAQAPHKAFSQIALGNRSLSTADRIKLGTAYVATFGVGYTSVYDAVDKILPKDDRVLHEIVSGGLTNLILNRTLSTLFGQDVNTDFSDSMRLLSVPQLGQMWGAMATMDMESILTKSPSVSLVLGDNARVGNLLKSMARAFTVPDDDGVYKDIGVNFLSMFSGASNIFKARYAFQRGYSVSTKGEVADGNVSEVEAMFKALGFNTVDEMLSFQANGEVYYMSKQFKDDVKYMNDETAKRLGREGISDKESEYVIRLYQEANRVYGKNPAAMAVVQADINRRAKSGDYILLNRLIEQAGLHSAEEMRDVISKSPLTEDQKGQLWKIIDFMGTPE